MDSAWDSIQTFVRIPAGAMLAAGAVGDVTPALEIAAGILGGSLAATSHATKAGTRLLINTSPSLLPTGRPRSPVIFGAFRHVDRSEAPGNLSHPVSHFYRHCHLVTTEVMAFDQSVAR